MDPVVTIEHAQYGPVKLTTITLYGDEDRQEMQVTVPPVVIPVDVEDAVAKAEEACGMYEPSDTQLLEERIRELENQLDDVNDAVIVAHEQIHNRDLQISDLRAAQSVLQAEYDGEHGRANTLHLALQEANRQTADANRQVEEWRASQRRRHDGYQAQAKLGSRYVFSEIPMEELEAFKAYIKPFFNSDRFRMRIRGQHVKPDVTGSRRRMAHQGHALEYCTHARIYIDEKVQVW